MNVVNVSPELERDIQSFLDHYVSRLKEHSVLLKQEGRNMRQKKTYEECKKEATRYAAEVFPNIGAVISDWSNPLNQIIRSGIRNRKMLEWYNEQYRTKIVTMQDEQIELPELQNGEKKMKYNEQIREYIETFDHISGASDIGYWLGCEPSNLYRVKDKMTAEGYIFEKCACGHGFDVIRPKDQEGERDQQIEDLRGQLQNLQKLLDEMTKK